MSDPLDALVAGIVARDEGAFATLYDHIADDLASFAYRMLRDRHTAEDAVQQAFLELARSCSNLRGDGRSLRAWLYRSVRFSVLDEVRRRSRRPELPTDEVPELPVSDSPVEGWDPRIEKALAALTPRHRAVLLLRYVEGFEPAEIARILGINRAAAYATSARAEAALRRALGTVESGALPASQLGEGDPLPGGQ